jgi:hypothetical protein
MHFAPIFAAGFASVFLLGFQSRNVNHGNYGWAAVHQLHDRAGSGLDLEA